MAINGQITSESAIPTRRPTASVPSDVITYVGCYKDNTAVRAMPFGGNRLKSILDCRALAATRGFIYFGTGWYNGPGPGQFECWLSNDRVAAIRYGPVSTGCVLATDKTYQMGKGGFLAIYMRN